MSLKPQQIAPVPEETAQVAKAAFPKGNLCLTLRDELGVLFSDEAVRRPVSHARSTCPSALAAGSGDDLAVCGEPRRSSGRRSRTQSH